MLTKQVERIVAGSPDALFSAIKQICSRSCQERDPVRSRSLSWAGFNKNANGCAQNDCEPTKSSCQVNRKLYVEAVEFIEVGVLKVPGSCVSTGRVFH
jgi:hypothetical protein